MKIGIMGVGVVGSALRNYLAKNPRNEFRLYDPARELNDDLAPCDIVFICVPAPTLEDRSQDLSAIIYCLERLVSIGLVGPEPIVIKSTVLPGTTDSLAKEHGLKVIHMPEFLTERRADLDMHAQDVLCGGKDTLSFETMKTIESLFPKKVVHFVRNKEAELAKYAHNGFAAVKVTYFNLIKEIADKLQISYPEVLKGTLLSGLIEREHTMVPGPDGHYGYGGKCLPKDLKALIGFIRNLGIPDTITWETENANYTFREKK